MTADDNEHVVVLYGSLARSDGDICSDRDLMVVGASPASATEPRHLNDSIVQYTWAEFSAMQGYGSLFLVHLAKEGLIVDGTQLGVLRYTQLLTAIPPYERADGDLLAFDSAVNDSEESLQLGDSSLEFELANLATIIRHCSILGCYLSGAPDFGRYSAVAKLTSRLGLPLGDEFPHLYSFRMALARGGNPPEGATVADAFRWCLNARRLVKGVRTLWTDCSYV